MTHQLPDGFTSRPATTDDAACVSELWNARSEANRHERHSTPARVLKTWDHPKFDLSTDSRLVFAPDGALVGYAHIRDVKDPRSTSSAERAFIRTMTAPIGSGTICYAGLKPKRGA